jgi:hypothetical protein
MFFEALERVVLDFANRFLVIEVRYPIIVGNCLDPDHFDLDAVWMWRFIRETPDY